MARFADLSGYLRFLENQNDLCRITAEVDPELEITEIATRVVRHGGPALLFERVKGSPYPVAINIFGTKRRMEQVLGSSAGQIGEELVNLACALNPPSLKSLWGCRGVIRKLLNFRTKKVCGNGRFKIMNNPDLNSLPALKCWPKDGGRFMTLPLVMTQDPVTGKRNTGFYRMQVFGGNAAGMHWQIERGGAFHYDESKKTSAQFNVSVVLGGDPAEIFAGAMPLPEGWDEMAFAGYLRGDPVDLIYLQNGAPAVPANAEFVLEGTVPLDELKDEGPFGDHLGHYSNRAPYPVFRLKRLLYKPGAIYPATVVGKPPQEDRFIGDAIQEIARPLLKLMHPELVDLWAYYEAGFHNLLVVSVKQRYRKEGIKTSLSLLGQGQLSLTKCLILVDPGVHPSDFHGVLEQIERNFDPKDDLLVIPATSGDTLDFTSFRMNMGSKMIIDATGDRNTTGIGRDKEKEIKKGNEFNGLLKGNPISEYRQFGSAMLVVKTRAEGRSVVAKMVQEKCLSGFKLIVAVSDDVSLDDMTMLIWGIFTRFDCSRDIVFARLEMDGTRPVYIGPMGIDATWKPGYPDPVEMTPEIVDLVNRRWPEYKIKL